MEVSSTSGPNPTRLGSMPPNDVPNPLVPWYAAERVIMCTLPGWPSTDQYWRTSLAAVSIDSPPPVVKKTRASGIGACSESRAASSAAGSLLQSPNVEYASSLDI